MITGGYEETSQPVEDGTRFTMNYDYQIPSRGVGKIIDRLYVEKMMVKDLETSLKNPKSPSGARGLRSKLK